MTMNRRRFLQTAGVGAGLGMTGAGRAFHDRAIRLAVPAMATMFTSPGAALSSAAVRTPEPAGCMR